MVVPVRTLSATSTARLILLLVLTRCAKRSLPPILPQRSRSRSLPCSITVSFAWPSASILIVSVSTQVCHICDAVWFTVESARTAAPDELVWKALGTVVSVTARSRTLATWQPRTGSVLLQFSPTAKERRQAPHSCSKSTLQIGGSLDRGAKRAAHFVAKGGLDTCSLDTWHVCYALQTHDLAPAL